jgi:hypothetical protein
LNLQCFSLRSTDYVTPFADVRLSSCAAPYSRFLWRQCVPLHFTSFWRRSHWTSITKFMSKHEIGPFCLIGTQREVFMSATCVEQTYRKDTIPPLGLNVLRVSYCASCRTSSPESLVAVSTGCPIRYRTRHFFHNSNTNEDIATKFEQGYVLFFHISYTMR